MSDYISREEFEKRIKPYDTDDSTDKALYNFTHNTLVCCPSADVRENVHGEWIAHEIGETIGDYICNFGDYTCSKCGHLINVQMRAFIKAVKYCENCGADMRKGEE